MKTPNWNETKFLSFLERHGKTWIFEPCKFDTGIPCNKLERNQTYTPDFYCPEEDIYYEVSATPGAYYKSIKKIKLVRQLRPDIIIEVVHPDGRKFKHREKRTGDFKICAGDVKLNVRLKIKIINKGKKQYQVARAIGMYDNPFSEIVRGWKLATDEQKEAIATELGCTVEDIF